MRQVDHERIIDRQVGIARFWCALLASVFAASAALAQTREITATAAVRDSAYYVGDEFIYEIRLEDVETTQAPDIELPPSLRLQSRSAYPRSSTVVINGRQIENEVSTTCRYVLLATAEGRETIPAQRLPTAAGIAVTNPVTIRVLSPQSLPGFALDFELPERDLYVGEIFPARVRWTIDGSVSPPSFASSVIPRAFELIPSELPPQGVAGTPIELQVFSTVANAVIEQNDIPQDSERFLVLDLRFRPTQAGEYNLGPLEATFNAQRPDSRARTRAITRSPVVSRRVLPLPSDGRPSTFDGLIGRYEVSISADRTTVNVGDPIELTCVVRSVDGLFTVEPDPVLPEGWQDRLITDPGGWQRIASNSREMVLSTTVRAASAETDAIPGFELHMFDPTLGEYTVARSQAIPIEAKPVKEITATGVARSPGQATQPTPPSWLSPSRRNVTATDRGVELLAASRESSLFSVDPRRVPIAVWITIFALPPVVAMAVLVQRSRAPADERLRRLSAAARPVRSRLAAGDHAGAVRTLLAAYLDASPAGISAATLEDEPMRAVQFDAAARDDARAILLVDESGRFSSVPPPVAPADPQTSVRSLQRSLTDHARTGGAS